MLCGGAYLKMQGDNIELGMPGSFTVKATNHEFIGPAHASTVFNTWGSTPFDDTYVLRDEDTLEPIANTLVEIIRGDGAVQRMKTDMQGRLPIQKDLLMDQVKLRVLSPHSAAGAKGNDV